MPAAEVENFEDSHDFDTGMEAFQEYEASEAFVGDEEDDYDPVHSPIAEGKSRGRYVCCKIVVQLQQIVPSPPPPLL